MYTYTGPGEVFEHDDQSPTNLAQIQLAAGQYLLLAEISLESNDNDTQSQGCSLYVNYDDSFTNSIDNWGSFQFTPRDTESITLTGTVLYTKPGYAVVGCAGYHAIGSANITAIPIGGVN